MSSDSLVVYSPVLAPTETGAFLAPRPATLEGARVGLLYNNRAGGERILEGVAKLLAAKYGLSDVFMLTKSYIGEPASKEIHDALLAKSDVVITAIGD